MDPLNKMMLHRETFEGTIQTYTAVKEQRGIAIRLSLTHIKEKGYNALHLKHINNENLK